MIVVGIAFDVRFLVRSCFSISNFRIGLSRFRAINLQLSDQNAIFPAFAAREFVISRGFTWSHVGFLSSDKPWQNFMIQLTYLFFVHAIMMPLSLRVIQAQLGCCTLRLYFILLTMHSPAGPMDSRAAIYPMLLSTESTGHITTEPPGERDAN
jgi:hypothetical protein